MNLNIPTIVNTTEALRALVNHAEEIGYIAVDTEFIWERTYYPKLGLIQLGFSKDECFLIDVLAELDLLPLGEVLVNPNVVKILHDAQQDLTILRQATGVYPKNVFDTRYAAGFIGVRSTISLCDLINIISGVVLAKTETRTNWLQRPLSPSQIEYALDDVRYLPDIREKLLARIEQCKHEAWLREDLIEYDNPDLYKERDPYEQYLQLKGLGKVPASRLAIIRELAAWREKEARKRDRPRGWIVTDEILINLARQKPRSLESLKSTNGLFERHIRKYGKSILSAIEKGISTKGAECPRHENNKNEYESLKTLIDFGLVIVKGNSQGHGIDFRLMATRSEIKALVFDGLGATSDRHRILRGWRKKILGEQLKLLLTG